MRIAYYVPATLLRHEGIRRRARDTVDAWRTAGHEVYEPARAPEPRRTDPISLWQWHRRRDAGAASELAALADAGRLDHVHARLLLPTLGWLRLAGTVPVSLEVHSLISRAESRRDLGRVVLGAVTARRLVRRAVAGVFVTHELQQHRDYRAIHRSLALGNGIAERPSLPAPENERPVLGMSVGMLGAWHGLDRFAALAGGMPDVRCVVVTPAKLRPAVSSELGTAAVEVWETHGPEDYEAAMRRLDAAVGTLALDRRGLTEAAPLKVRDYLMLGIPTLITYDDTNLASVDDPCLLRLPGHRAPGAAQVRAWVHDVRGCRLADTTRLSVSIATLERRRLDLLTSSAG